MTLNKPVFLALVGTMFTAAGSAAAQYPYPPPPAPPQPGYGYAPRPVQTFGGPGTLAISNDMNLGFYGSSISDNGGSSWTFTLAPAADYFVIQGLSLGAQVVYTHTNVSGPSAEGSTTSTTTNTDTFGIGPRVGYNIPINDLLSFWPKLALIYTDIAMTGASGSTFDIQLYAPLLLHLAPHFFVGLGPKIQTDLTASANYAGTNVPNPPKTTSYGLYFTIGGWTVPGG
jgi:hypothetical protein